MYKGKYSNKKKRRLAPWAALALALVLTLSVGGTIAYLITDTGPVTNTFTPGKTDISIDEQINGPSKNEITVKNDGNVPVYIRVVIVANYHTNMGDVCGQHSSVSVPAFSLNSNWLKASDGFYYYKKPVSAGGSTENLIAQGSSITLNNAADGCVMHVDVLAQSIQAEGVDAGGNKSVVLAWGVTVDADGNISK